jgi:hypothetical protein
MAGIDEIGMTARREERWPATWTGETVASRKIALTMNIPSDVASASGEGEQRQGAVALAMRFVRPTTRTTSVSESTASHGLIGAAVTALVEAYTPPSRRRRPNALRNGFVAPITDRSRARRAGRRPRIAESEAGADLRRPSPRKGSAVKGSANALIRLRASQN